jgi:integrase
MSYILKAKCKYKVDKTGSAHELPCVLTESGVLTSHVQYLYRNRTKSQSWIEKSISSIILLIKYIHAHTQSLSEKHKIKGVDLLRDFTAVLNLGTIDLNGNDPSGLFWKVRNTRDAQVVLYHITQYTDSLGKGNGCQVPINRFRKASHTEEKMNWCAYYHRKAGIFLNHLEDKKAIADKMQLVRTIQSNLPEIIVSEKVFRFQEDKVESLLKYGFITKGSIYPDYKNQLITMLMHYGGLRLSETFHIYLNDIICDYKENEAIVRVYHPSSGLSPESAKQLRKTYLQEKYALKPRNEYSKNLRLHAGWKSPLLTNNNKYFEIIFAPSSSAKLFLKTWINYLRYQRADPPSNYQHPFAFTNSDGHPESIKNFRRMHDSAVRRIGLKVGKDEGTSCHSHRHSYGYRLYELGFSQVEIQKSMHHKSPDSCLVYIQPTSENIRDKMRVIESKLHCGASSE